MTSNLDPGTRVRVAATVYSRAFGNELVLLDFGRGEYFALDEIGAEIWKRIEAGDSLGEVADAVVAAYDVSHDVALRDIFELVVDMRDRGLLTVV